MSTMLQAHEIQTKIEVFLHSRYFFERTENDDILCTGRVFLNLNKMLSVQAEILLGPKKTKFLRDFSRFSSSIENICH